MVKLSAGDDERHALFFHTESLDPVNHFSPDLEDSEGKSGEEIFRIFTTVYPAVSSI
jgi:hypothetical protein